MPGRPVIVPGTEERVVVSPLKLQTGFQNFRGDVDDRRSKICNKTYIASVNGTATETWASVTSCKIGYGRVDARIEQMSLAVFVCAKKDHSAWERSQHGCLNSTIQAFPNALLSENFDVRIRHGTILWWEVRVSLLTGLYSIERMHQDVTACTPDAPRQH